MFDRGWLGSRCFLVRFVLREDAATVDVATSELFKEDWNEYGSSRPIPFPDLTFYMFVVAIAVLGAP